TVPSSLIFMIHIPQTPRTTVFPYTTLFRSLFPGEEENNARLRNLYETANWWPQGKPKPKTAVPKGPATVEAEPVGAVSASKTGRSEEHTSELQSPDHLVCRLLLEKKKQAKQ